MSEMSPHCCDHGVSERETVECVIKSCYGHWRKGAFWNNDGKPRPILARDVLRASCRPPVSTCRAVGCFRFGAESQGRQAFRPDMSDTLYLILGKVYSSATSITSHSGQKTSNQRQHAGLFPLAGPPTFIVLLSSRPKSHYQYHPCPLSQHQDS